MKNTKVIAIALAFALTYSAPAFITKADTQSTVPAPVVPLVNSATYHLRITAYSSSADETDDTPFITASGQTVRDGIVATNMLPLGTKVQIPGLFGNKVFTVEDRMSPKFPKTIDIWMVTKSKAIYFGLHYADVVVLQDNPISLK